MKMNIAPFVLFLTLFTSGSAVADVITMTPGTEIKIEPFAITTVKCSGNAATSEICNINCAGVNTNEITCRVFGGPGGKSEHVYGDFPSLTAALSVVKELKKAGVCN